tara:strand:+ start:883 stop:1368 length:486 start_codon:yes stop_codon:yes gene_type:complete
MEEDKMNMNLEKCEAWLSQSDRGDIGGVIEAQISLARNAGNDEERERLWVAIRSLGAMYPDWSNYFKRGRGSSMPDSVQNALASVLSDVQAAYTQMANDYPVILSVATRHGKSGGGLYESVEEYVDSEVKKVNTRLTKHYRNGEWNGELPVSLDLEVNSED